MSPALSTIRTFTIAPLAACLALALATSETIAQTPVTDSHVAPSWARKSVPHGMPRMQGPPRDAVLIQPAATTLEVTNCSDNEAAGTLRYEIFHAPEGGTVDMSNLICSTITLANGAIVIGQHNLNVTASASNPIRIDAHGASRVVEGNSTSASMPGTLYLKNLELANGYIRNDSSSASTLGGCLYWPGANLVTLQSTIVTGCQVINAVGAALGGAVASLSVNAYGSTFSESVVNGLKAVGGGIFAFNATLHDSVISGNQALSGVNAAGAYANGGGIADLYKLQMVRTIVTNNLAQAIGSARGGGIYNEDRDQDGGVDIAYSTISGNLAVSPGSSGGGISAIGTSTIACSTIDHNQSVNNSALSVSGIAGDTVVIRNSTISTNTATTGSSAVFASIPLAISNSTIAFNVAAGSTAGLYLYPGGNVDLESTIIASNTSTAGGGFDLVSRAMVTGSHNLVRNPGITLPANVAMVGVDPLLASLANNGGLTRTHSFQIGSPAIDAGSNPQFLPFDQRGPGFGRVVGAAADIGAYEAKSDRIFANGFE